MKGKLVRKGSGCGAISGRLKAPDVVMYEDAGSLKEARLTGGVVETEYNDVLILGKETPEGMEVQWMEGLSPKYGFLYASGEGIQAVAVPDEMLRGVESRIGDNGRQYKALRFSIGKNETLYLSATVYEPSKSGVSVFVLFGPLRREESEFGEGYAKVRRVVYSGSGAQLLS